MMQEFAYTLAIVLSIAGDVRMQVISDYQSQTECLIAASTIEPVISRMVLPSGIRGKAEIVMKCQKTPVTWLMPSEPSY